MDSVKDIKEFLSNSDEFKNALDGLKEIGDLLKADDNSDKDQVDLLFENLEKLNKLLAKN